MATPTPEAAQAQLDTQLREIIQWHFSPETGCPFWLNWAAKAGWDPRTEIHTSADLIKFPHFQDEWLRDLQPEVWVPKAYAGRPFNIFETGGTTGMPKQRIGWEDSGGRFPIAVIWQLVSGYAHLLCVIDVFSGHSIQ